MATNKTIAPTGVTVQIPGLTDAPDMSVPANAIDKAIDGINALNSQIGSFKSASNAISVGAGSSVSVTIDATSGTYMVLVARPDRTKTGVFIVDGAGASELVYCGASVALSGSTITVTNSNQYTMYVTVYRMSV